MSPDPNLAQKVIKFLESHAMPGHPCPICGKSSWTVSDRLWEFREFRGGALVAGGTVFPVVLLLCTNCGNTLAINAIVAGVFSPQEGQPNDR